MNKKCLLLLSAMLAVAISYAQNIRAGIKADMNLFRIYGDGMSRQFHPGISAGFFAQTNLCHKWGLQAELFYSQRNTKTKEFSKFFSGSVSPAASSDVFLSYVGIPLMLTYSLNSAFTIQAGGQYNYLVYADEDLLKDSRDAFKKNEIGLIGGVEYAYSRRFGFYGRFQYGLNNINNINAFHVWNTQQIQVGASYSLFSSRTAGQEPK